MTGDPADRASQWVAAQMSKAVRANVLALQANPPDWNVGTSGHDLQVDDVIDALAVGRGGYIVLHPIQVTDLVGSLFATIGGTPDQRVEQLADVLALNLVADPDDPVLVGRVFDVEIWSWTRCRLVNGGADREGLLVGPVPVRITSDAEYRGA
jgi:hypothetical protein